MKEATARCLRDDCCADSIAHVRYVICARAAEEEGFPSVARLFRALALSRYTRAAEQYVLASDLLGSYTVTPEAYFTLERAVDNLERARTWEACEADDVLAAHLAVATAQGETAAIRSLKRAVAVGRRRAALLEDIIQKMHHEAGEPAIAVFVCQACGNVVEAPVTGTCVVCDADRECFVRVE